MLSHCPSVGAINLSDAGADGARNSKGKARFGNRRWSVAVKSQPYNLALPSETIVCHFGSSLEGYRISGYDTYIGDKIESFNNVTRSALDPRSWGKF
jgi:hypothetical protein